MVPLERLPTCSITKQHPLSISRVNWEDGVSKKGRKMEERGRGGRRERWRPEESKRGRWRLRVKDGGMTQELVMVGRREGGDARNDIQMEGGTYEE